MKKITSLCVALCMMITMIPSYAFAAENNKKDISSMSSIKAKVYEKMEEYLEEGNAPSKTSVSVAEVNGVAYATLQEAVDNAADGDTVKMLTDIFDECIAITKDITLDTDGYALVANDDLPAVTIEDAEVTIKDGGIVNTSYGIMVVGDSVLNITTTIILTEDEGSMALYVGQGSELYAEDCMIANESEISVYGIVVDGGEAELHDCLIYLTVGNCLMTTGDVELKNCYFGTEEGFALYSAQDGLDEGFIEVNGGEYYGTIAGVNADGKIRIISGLFESIIIGGDALYSNGKTTSEGIVIATGSVTTPSNWRTTSPDVVAVIKNLAAPASTKVNLSGKYNQIKATWNKVSGATGYAVYYKKGTGSYKFYKNTTNRYVTISGLSAGAKYTVKVVPYKKLVGDLDTVRAKGTKYSTASTYTLKKIVLKQFYRSDGKVRVRWNNISGETGYQISKSSKKTGTYIVSTYKTTSGNNKLVKATKGKRYYYKVRAYKSVWNGEKYVKVYGNWSDPKAFTR